MITAIPVKMPHEPKPTIKPGSVHYFGRVPIVIIYNSDGTLFNIMHP